MKKYLKILCRSSLFKDISEEDLLPMLGCLGASVRAYKNGEIIFSEGDTADLFGIVLSGRVQISQVDYYGNRSIVANVEPTQIFGESFACAEVEALPVDVVAIEACEIMLVEARRVTRACGNACSFHSRIIFNLMKIVARKNLAFHQKLEITSKRTTKDKLMSYLLTEAKKANADSFTIPYNRQELADYLHVERSGLSSEIGKLHKEGVLISERKKFRLLKPHALRGFEGAPFEE